MKSVLLQPYLRNTLCDTNFVYLHLSCITWDRHFWRLALLYSFIFRGTTYCHIIFLHRVGLPYTSDQSTFVKPKVNVLKDIQILTKTTYVQQEADNMLIPLSSSWVILSGYCLENITTSRRDCCPQLIHLVTSGEIVISLSKI